MIANTAHCDRKPGARSAVRLGGDRQFDGTDAQSGRTVAGDRPAFRAALSDRADLPESSSRCLISSCGIISASARWCSLPILSGALMNSAEPRPGDFPYWLYDKSLLAYAARLMSWPAIEHVSQRISIGLGLRKRNDPDGFFSYEDIWLPGTFRADKPAEGPGAGGHRRGPRQSFPKSRCSTPRSSGFRPMWPSFWSCRRPFIPRSRKPGTAAAAEREACNAALQRIVAGRPHSNFINYRDRQCADPRSRELRRLHSLSPEPLPSRMAEGIAASIKIRRGGEDRFLINPRRRPDPRNCRSSHSLRARLRWILPLVVFGKRARPDQHDMPREQLVLLGHVFADQIPSSRPDRSGCVRCARSPAR